MIRLLWSTSKSVMKHQIYKVPCRNITSRKVLLPVVKAIHPDKFTQESQSIQDDNLSCLQTLNEIWDIMNKIEKEVDSKISANINMVHILKPLYVLNCHIRNSEFKLELKKMHLKVPLDLCNKKSLSIIQVKRALTEFYKNFGCFFQNLAMENPFPRYSENITEKAEDDMNAALNNDDLNQMMTSESVDSLFMETYIKMSSAFDESDIINSEEFLTKKMQKDTKEKIIRRAAMFAAHGHVKLKGISAEFDPLAVPKMTEFLQEFAHYINFKPNLWKNVYIIIHGFEKLSDDEALASFLDEFGKSYPLSERAVNAKSRQERKMYREIASQYGYGVEDGVHVLFVPREFREKTLLDFILTMLPHASDYQEIDRDTDPLENGDASETTRKVQDDEA